MVVKVSYPVRVWLRVSRYKYGLGTSDARERIRFEHEQAVE